MLGIARQSQAQIGIERALVIFIKNHQTDASQFRIIENHPGKHTLGHNFDSGAGGNLRLQPHAQANGFADGFAQGGRHPLACRAGSQPPRLQQNYFFARQPWLIDQRQWHPRRFASTWRGHQHQRIARCQAGRNIIQQGVNREGGMGKVHDISWQEASLQSIRRTRHTGTMAPFRTLPPI